MTPREKIKELYIAVNEMMAIMGAEGEVTTRDISSDRVMNALHEMDDGSYLFEEQAIEEMVNQLFHVDQVDPSQMDLFKEKICIIK